MTPDARHVTLADGSTRPVAPLRLTSQPDRTDARLAGAIDAFARAVEQSPRVDFDLCRRLMVAALGRDRQLTDRQARRLLGEEQVDAVAAAALGLPMGFIDHLVARLLLAGIRPWGLTVAQAVWLLDRLGRPAGSADDALGILNYRIDDRDQIDH